MKQKSPLDWDHVATIHSEAPKQKPTVDRLKEVIIGEQEDEITYVSEEICTEEQNKITDLLKQFKHLFAWKASQMPGIHPSVACHRLHVDPRHKPVRQKPRRMAPERRVKVTSRIKFASNSFAISSLTLTLLSGAIRLGFCLTGLCLGSICSP